MEIIKAYTKQDVTKLTRKRSGEEKIGEVVSCVTTNWQQDLKNTASKFVIVGIAEDIGVRANYGRAGASTAFIPALDSFLNQQNNDFLSANSIFILGEVFVDDLMEQASQLNIKSADDVATLRDLVLVIDERVSAVIKFVVGLNKIPIIIGGGHNNAFGNIKGSSEALSKKINAINCDPHLDFRAHEGRHSGNGFSYAYDQGFLNKYAVFAMHEQYNNQKAFGIFKTNSTELFYNTYESIFVREELDMSKALKQAIHFVKQEACGIEIDLDSITNVPSSAKTSSGISPTQARQYVYQCAKQLNALYLHIAEGAPVLSHIKADNKTGKLIAYLITDFLKGCQYSES
jgi:formiminoglutamase